MKNSKYTIEYQGQLWYLTAVGDSTHFYMSNDPDKKGLPYHIAEHKHQPYYEEVYEWLKYLCKEEWMEKQDLLLETYDEKVRSMYKTISSYISSNNFISIEHYIDEIMNYPKNENPLSLFVGLLKITNPIKSCINNWIDLYGKAENLIDESTDNLEKLRETLLNLNK